MAQNQNPRKSIDVSNPDIHLISEDYSSINVSKVTVLYGEETSSGASLSRDYYLLSDGTITTTQTQENRVEGEWKLIYTKDEIDVESAAYTELNRAQYGHKIVFDATNMDFNLYDKVRIRLNNGNIVDSFVSGITETKNSKIKRIECGELQTQYPFL